MRLKHFEKSTCSGENCPRFGFVVLAVVLLTACAQKRDSPEVVRNVDPYDNYRDWAIYRGDKKSNQYAELAQINATNVHRLQPVWEYHTGQPEGPSMYSNPIIVNGLMYFTTARLDAVALNAATVAKNTHPRSSSTEKPPHGFAPP